MNINDTLLDMGAGLPDDIRQHQQSGNYAEAIRLIDLRLQQNNLPNCLRNSLIAHRERFCRIPAQFPYTKEEALAILRKQIPDFTMEELNDQMDLRNVRWIYVNGEMRIFQRFDQTLFAVVDDIRSRLPQTQENVQRTDYAMGIMKEKGVMANRIRVRQTVKLSDELFTPGMFLRAHLPLPAACQQQSDIRIERIFPETASIAPEDAPQRTVCWEVRPQENPEFTVEYSYTHTARYQDVYNGKGQPGGYDFDLQEQYPHIVFTPFIRSLCKELTEGLEDPLAKARAIYDFITRNMRYTHVPDYFVLDSIAESCARNYNGDCGVFALLFITLCRCAGIPARWQSGLVARPEEAGCHDWAQFYVEPYGWVFADPSFGVSANRLGKEDRRQFVFGNLDPYRMVANRAFQADFTIPKTQWRADPYDNQAGELESDSCGFRGSQLIRTQTTLSCQEITD